MSELPKGWVSAKLGDYIHLKNGFAFKSKDYSEPSNMTVPVIRISDINGKVASDKKANHVPAELAVSEFEIAKGDLLVAMSGATTGKIGVYGGSTPAYQNQRVGNLKLNAPELSDLGFRNHLIKYLSPTILEIAYGGAQPNISASGIENIGVCFPPLAEQKRIVEKLDEVLAQVDTIKARLDGIPAILKRFRQSVLAAAVSGKLTEEWRGDSEYDSECFPSSWSRKGLDDLGALARGKSKHRPRNDPRLFGNEYPFIQTGEVAQSNGVIECCTKWYSEFGLEQSRLFPKGTLCITIAANIADTAILAIDACFPDSVVGFIPNPEVTSALFVKYLIDVNKNRLEQFAPATAQKNINLKVLKSLSLPYPTIDEQNEIVNQVERYFAFADTIEAQVRKAQARVDKLTQSILAKAFRGELVPQDPNDEPADKLLERIALARKEAEALTKAAKKAGASKEKANKAAVKG
ncbi:restriction endonuclease subunit S [Vibrio sp. 1180_3]|uniref:restriction endonuclease subunit S n=1 Tax=Vibrio sp. 1180_3 TaxID=2528832 RepID=UPI002406ECF7|nr:restriction endonuclease subunit S [Vibrio sp. 1180_3]